MSRIYLVQSATDLVGANGYSCGLLEGGHPWVLVSFLDYMGKPEPNPILRPKSLKAGRKVASRKPTLNAKKKG